MLQHIYAIRLCFEIEMIFYPLSHNFIVIHLEHRFMNFELFDELKFYETCILKIKR